MVLCLFYCYKSILKEHGGKELKQLKKRRKWHFSMKHADFGQTSQPFRTEAQRCGASFRETEPNFLFSTVQTLGNLAERILTPLAI